MAKDTFYFSHDYNARNDKKISALVKEFKSAGYGIFWATAEMLHEEGGEIELDDLTISAISKDLNEDFDMVKLVINKCILSFKLFHLSNDNILTANRVRRNLDKRKEISKVRSDAGKAGANAKQMLTNAKQNVAKERKGKEIKESKEIKEEVQQLWFMKLYHSTYDVYKSQFNGKSASKEIFVLWKKFVDHIYKNDYDAIFDAKFITPHGFEKVVKEDGFTEEKWDLVIQKILSTGVNPKQDLFFRIPQFIKYGEQSGKQVEILVKPKTQDDIQREMEQWLNED